MKLFIILVAFLPVFLFSAPEVDDLDEDEIAQSSIRLTSAEIGLDYSYRYKTNRELEKDDVPSLNYSTSFTFNSIWTVGLFYGSFPFKQTDENKMESDSLGINLSYITDFSDSPEAPKGFFFMMDGSYNYYTDHSNPSEYSANIMLSYTRPFLSVFKAVVSGRIFFSYVDSINNDFNYQESRQYYTPSVYFQIKLPLGFYLKSNHSYEPYFYTPFYINYNPDGSISDYGYEKQRTYRYWEHTFSIGAQLVVFDGKLIVVADVSKGYAYKLKKEYPFPFGETIEDYMVQSGMVRFIWYPTEKRDISVYFGLKNQKNIFNEDLYILFGVSFTL